MTPFEVKLTSSETWTEEQMEVLFAEGFPAFIVGDQEVKKHIGRARELFAEFDIVLTNEAGQPVATGWGVPIAWSGEAAELSSSFASLLLRSLEVHDASRGADTFVICGAVVHPAHKGGVVAETLIRSLIDTALDHKLLKVLAPVRPTLKHLYPLLSIEEYANWVRSDGLPWDPWLRLHVRIGGQIIGLAKEAQTMTGSAAQWEEWTSLEFPVSGDYIIANGMAPLHMEKTADVGIYVEPNVWVRHR